MAYGDVDLNLLIVLDRLLARQSVTEAAEDLGLSASATSRALQRLRDALGDPLLQRAGNRLVPTPLARDLVAPAGRAVEAAREVFERERAFDPAQASGEFVVALTPEMQRILAPTIATHICAAAPGIDLRFKALTMQSADEGRRDVIHLALGPDLTMLPNVPELPDATEFVHRDLYRRHFVVAANPAHWPDAPDLERYVAAQHIIMSSDGGGEGFMDHLLAARGWQRRVACSVSTFSAVLDLVHATSMLALVPSEVLSALGEGLLEHPPPLDVPSMDMRMMWHPRHTTQQRHRALRTLIADAVSGCAFIEVPPAEPSTPA